MAKNKMGIKYKSRKRQRNKQNAEEVSATSKKSLLSNILGVAVFLGVMYLLIIGMEKLGLFEIGYTAPDKGETEISYEFIPIGTVFTRSEKTYYVLFDDYSNVLSRDNYINTLLEGSKISVYKVDMSINENAKYKGEKPNKKATKASELSINDITLIRITNGRISNYLVGSDEIEEYLSK